MGSTKSVWIVRVHGLVKEERSNEWKYDEVKMFELPPEKIKSTWKGRKIITFLPIKTFEAMFNFRPAPNLRYEMTVKGIELSAS